MGDLTSVVFVLIGTLLVTPITAKLKLPDVVGQIFIGIILGAAVLNWVHPNGVIVFLAEVGVILLMFMAGIESNLHDLRKYLKPSLYVAVFGVIVSFALMYFGALALSFDNKEALFFGLLFSATSVSISVEVLKEQNFLNTKEGATVLSAAVVDDILCIVLLSVMSASLGESSSGYSLPQVFGLQILFFVLAWILIKYGAKWLMFIARKVPVFSNRLIMAIIISFGFAVIAEKLQLSSVVGAFFAGIAIAQTKSKHAIDDGIQAIGYSLFIPVFFANIGLGVSFHNIGSEIWEITILTILAILGKQIGSGVGAKLAGFDWASSNLVGAAMVSRGEMALIILQIGMTSKLISRDVYSVLTIVILLTTIISPVILKHTITIKKRNSKKRQKIN